MYHRITKMFLSGVVSMLCVNGIAVERLSNLGKEYVQKPDEVVRTLLEKGADIDEYAHRTMIGLKLQGIESAVDKENMQHILRFSAAKENFSKAASLLALSKDRLAWCQLLMQNRGGEELAAAAQAVAALMLSINEDKLVQTGVKIDKMPGIDANIVDALLGSKSAKVKELAATAAVYSKNAALQKKVIGLEKFNTGAALGLILLAKVQTGSNLTLEEVETALKGKKQPKAMRTISAQVMWDQLFVPSVVPAAEAIALSKDKSFVPQLIEIFEHKDMRAQMTAAKAMAVLEAPEVLPVLHKRLAKIKEHEWPLSVEICNALGAIPAAESIQVLIDFLDEQDGRMRQDAIYALSSIRGEKNYLGTAKDWQAWWDGAQADFKVDPDKTKLYRTSVKIGDVFVPSLGNFYGLNILSSRICFVVDSSRSMQGDKIENLRAQGEMTIDGLDSVVRFNLVDYGSYINILYPGGLTNDKRGAIKQLMEMPLNFATRSYDAMQVGMEINEVDTIYFLSDGEPTRTEMKDWHGIMNMLNFQHRFRQIAFYTISFSAGKDNAKHMKRLSKLNVGKSKEIE